MNDIILDNLVIGYDRTPLIGSFSISSLSPSGGRLRGGELRSGWPEGGHLTIEAGRLTCLVGRNGVGKSTLLRTIAGLQPPLSGTVSIGGEDISRLSPSRRAKKVSIVLTRQPESGSLTVAEAVALGRMPYTNFWGTLTAEDRRIVEEAMRLTDITSLAHKRLARLSDGERQKAMIARAIAQQTPVILLDEPTAFLDHPSKESLFELLTRLAHEHGKTILLSTHDLELANRFADRMLTLTSTELSV